MKVKYNSNLPRTRFEQIIDVLHYHLFEIIIASIYTFLFSLPAFLWIIFTSSTSIFQGEYLLNVILIYGVLAILIGVMGLGYAGGLYFFKRLLFNEGVNINKDYIIGIKKNGKNLFIIFLLLGLSYLLLHTSISMINNLNLEINLKIIMIGISYALFFIIMIIILFMATQTILYQASFKQLLLNGILFCFGYLYKNIFILLISCLPFIFFEFSLIDILKWLSVLISMGFYFGFSQVVLTSFSFHVFDLTINKKQFKDYLRKGLAKNETDNL